MRVFISHAFGDAELAQRVGRALREAGFEVWNATTDILPGDNWGKELGAALEESDAMVVLPTPESVHAQNVSYELSYALGNEAYKGRVIPVIAAPPERLSPDEIPWILKRFRVVQFADQDEEGLKQIAQALAEAA